MLDNKGCSFHPHVTLVRSGPAARRSRIPTRSGHNTNIASARVQSNRSRRMAKIEINASAGWPPCRCRSRATSIRS